MEYLRTPDSRFNNLKDYPFTPNYISIDGFRMHYVREGSLTSPTVLLLHGEPTWSYLYRKMIPLLTKAGFQVVAPDLIGFGKSDKPISSRAYTYARHIEWLNSFIKILDLKDITVFFQDWGSLIGLRAVLEEPDRFSRIILSNGGLPTGDENIPKAFKYWLLFSKFSPWFPIGKIIQSASIVNLDKEIIKAYDAPFPSRRYKIGARVFPRLVPITPNNPESEKNRIAWKKLKSWEKPFLTAFGNRDPVTRGAEKQFQQYVPGCKNQNHQILKNAGHFIQEDKSHELSELIINFVRSND